MGFKRKRRRQQFSCTVAPSPRRCLKLQYAYIAVHAAAGVGVDAEAVTDAVGFWSGQICGGTWLVKKKYI